MNDRRDATPPCQSDWYEREKAAFIIWWESEGQEKFGETPTIAAGAGWLARAEAASTASETVPILPEGWALVPTVPTEEMFREGEDAMRTKSDPQGIYIRMLDSAPQPPTCDPSSLFPSAIAPNNAAPEANKGVAPGLLSPVLNNGAAPPTEMQVMRMALSNTAACLGDALATFNKLAGDEVFKNADSTPSATLPPQVANILRELCYVPGHYEEIRHLNYCRWCHYVEGHAHNPACVMALYVHSIPEGK